MENYLGVDLTASSRRPAAWALLNADAGVAALGAFGEDGELLELAARYRPELVAIDAPLGLPAGWACLDAPCGCGACVDPESDRRRATEVALRRAGIALYWTTRRSIIKAMVYRAMGLRRDLEEAGVRVIEVFPYGTKIRLWGRPIPPKTTPAGIAFLHERLGALFPGLDPSSLGHDAADALLAAYTAYLLARGMAEVTGDRMEGQIVLPLLDAAPAVGARAAPTAHRPSPTAHSPSPVARSPSLVARRP